MNTYSTPAVYKKKKWDYTKFLHKGIVISSMDNIAQIEGLRSATSGELVINNNNGEIGLILNLSKNKTGVVSFKNNTFEYGNIITRLFTTLSTKINPYTLGSVFDSLGNILNRNFILSNVPFNNIINNFGIMKRNIEIKAPGIVERQPVYESLSTGFLGIDGLLPLGKGQRELIIGDRQTGKTAIAVDIFLNQSNTDLILLNALFYNKKNYEK